MLERAEAWLHLSPEQWLSLLIILAPVAIMLAVLTEVARALYQQLRN